MRRKETVTIQRIIVVRTAQGDKQSVVRCPLPAAVRLPVLERGGFGAEVYSWNGKETTVAGLPVYR